MDKRRAIQIMTKAAERYRDNLEDQKVFISVGANSLMEIAIISLKKTPELALWGFHSMSRLELISF